MFQRSLVLFVILAIYEKSLDHKNINEGFDFSFTIYNKIFFAHKNKTKNLFFYRFFVLFYVMSSLLFSLIYCSLYLSLRASVLLAILLFFPFRFLLFIFSVFSLLRLLYIICLFFSLFYYFHFTFFASERKHHFCYVFKASLF